LDKGLKTDMVSSKELELFNKLNQLYLLRRDKMMKKWRRCLPLNELFVDRWEKARYLDFGEGTSVYDSCLILGDVKVGKHTWIGPFTILDGSGGLEIGDYCSISAGVQIYTHDSVAWAISGGVKHIERAPTKIGSRSYIGPNTIIGRGVTIGEGCIIGAFSLVLNDIKSGSSASGIPCKVKRKKG
jgi:acetyltransferase-like isoleucine patch superfamily enzyme